jgi:hypothetical protein
MEREINQRPVEKSAACQSACQQAVDYGVWPEHSCSPKCVYLDQPQKGQGANPLNPACPQFFRSLSLQPGQMPVIC